MTQPLVDCQGGYLAFEEEYDLVQIALLLRADYLLGKDTLLKKAML